MSGTVVSVSCLNTDPVAQGGDDDEAKTNVSVSQERQRTLEKLRSLRQVRNAGSSVALSRVVASDFLLLTPPPPTALPRSGDLEVQPTAPESASEPEEDRAAAQHSGSQRPDRLHLGPPRTLRSSSCLGHL